MKLIIVEDELRLRRRISDIEWLENGIDLIGSVENGKEALEQIERVGVDIVLADIRMPVMDGLELAGHLNNRSPGIKVIMLTGHDEFDYARESLRLGVFDYLLKPASNEEVLKAVQKAADERRQDLEKQYSYEMLKAKWREQLPYLQDTFWRNWMQGRYNVFEINRWAQELSIGLSEQIYVPVVVDMDPVDENGGRFTNADRPLLLFSLYSIAKEVLDPVHSVVVQGEDSLTEVIFFGSPDEPLHDIMNRVNQGVNQLLSTVRIILKTTASAGIGIATHLREALPEASKKSRQALQMRIVHGPDIVIPYYEDAEKAQWIPLTDMTRQLKTVLELGDEKLAAATIEMMMKADLCNRVNGIREFLIHICGIISSFVHEQNWLLSTVLQDDYTIFENLQELVTKEQVREWLVRTVTRVCNYVNVSRTRGPRQTVVDMIRLIEEQLHEEVSLYKISEMMYMNPSYLSRLFKREMNLSFSDYVIKCRMEKAKLLLEQDYKVYEVAEQCGFKQVNYFSKVFHKYWGVKPSDVTR